MTVNPMTDTQFHWFLTLVTGGVSAIWFVSDLRKLIRTGRKDGMDPSVRDQRFGYSMGLFIATLGMVGSAKYMGWISFASAATPARAVAFEPRTRAPLEDFGGDLVVTAKQESFPDAAKVVAVASAIDPDVVMADVEVELEATLNHTAKIRIAGVTARRAKALAKYDTAGALIADSATEPTIALGVGAAEQLGVKVGDTIDVAGHTVRVVAIKATGLAEYDYTTGWMNLGTAQALGATTTRVTIDLDHDDRARRIGQALQSQLGDGYKVVDWCANNVDLGCTWQPSAD